MAKLIYAADNGMIHVRYRAGLKARADAEAADLMVSFTQAAADLQVCGEGMVSTRDHGKSFNTKARRKTARTRRTF